MALDGAQDPILPSPRRAKVYNRIRLTVGITSSSISLVFFIVIVTAGASRALSPWTQSLASSPYGALMIFAFVVGLAHFFLTIPFSFYSGYILEHRYHLSNQSPGRWAWENLKAIAVGLPLAAGGMLAVYACLERFGEWWWLPVGVILTAVTVLFARLAPVILFPLFYTFTPLPEGSLKHTITNLCTAVGIPFAGIFTFNLSKNSKKANAGFAGIGKAKRIILGDTLINEFTEPEIESVFAHELGHYAHHHLLAGMVTGAGVTFLGLFITSRLYAWSLGSLGFAAPTDLAALPLLVVWLSVFGAVSAPLVNVLSRRHEQQADEFAVRKTGNPKAFVSALRKLAAMNLADPCPHPLVEFLFYSHPSIGRRVRAVGEGDGN